MMNKRGVKLKGEKYNENRYKFQIILQKFSKDCSFGSQRR